MKKGYPKHHASGILFLIFDFKSDFYFKILIIFLPFYPSHSTFIFCSDCFPCFPVYTFHTIKTILSFQKEVYKKQSVSTFSVEKEIFKFLLTVSIDRKEGNIVE